MSDAELQGASVDPLDVIALEAILEPFCPVAVNGENYHPEICRRAGCTICEDLLLKKGGTG